MNDMPRKNVKTSLAAAFIISTLLIASLLIFMGIHRAKPPMAYVLPTRNTEQHNITNAFRFINRLLQNDFKVYLVAEKTKMSNSFSTLEIGDFIISRQQNNIYPFASTLLHKYIEKLSEELNVTIKEINFDFQVTAFPLKKARVAVYYGGGATGGSLEHIYPLEETDFELNIFDSSDLKDAELSKYDVITFPGGGPYEEYLDENVISEIKNFVSNGGGFVGTCGGAAFGVNIGLLNAKLAMGELYPQYPEYADFRGPVKLKIFCESPVTVGYADFLNSVYFRGPFFSKAGTNVNVIALFHSLTEDTQVFFPEITKAYNFSLNTEAIGRFWNTPAVISGEYGKGKVVLSSVHPEILNESQRFFINSIYFALSDDEEPLSSRTLHKNEHKIFRNNKDLDLFLNETVFLNAIDLIQKLSVASREALDIISNFTGINNQIVGVTGDFLKLFLCDINLRSLTIIEELEKLKIEYEGLRNIENELKGFSNPFLLNKKLLSEVNNLQSQIVEIIDSAYKIGSLHTSMIKVHEELLNEINMLKEIMSCEKNFSRYEKIIELHGCESLTLSKLKDYIDCHLLMLCFKIKSLLIRLDFFKWTLTSFLNGFDVNFINLNFILRTAFPAFPPIIKSCSYNDNKRCGNKK